MQRFVWGVVLGLAGCGDSAFFGQGEVPNSAPPPPPAEVVAPDTAAPAEPVDAVADDPVEVASAPETPAAPTADPNLLGQETVALGDPSEAGLWVKTALVSVETQGIATAANGERVPVTLRPLEGAGGPQISLQALQTLGLPLAGLSPVALQRI